MSPACLQLLEPAEQPQIQLLLAHGRPESSRRLQTRRQPWTEDGFRTSYGKACKRAGIGVEFGPENDLHFHDLRGTAVVNLARAGCTVPEIRSITGHTLRSVEAILEASYLGRDQVIAINAMAKLDAAQLDSEVSYAGNSSTKENEGGSV